MVHLSNEGDVAGHVLPRLIDELVERGFAASAVQYQVPISAQQGRKSHVIFADVVVNDPAKPSTPLVVIETKPPEPFQARDAGQAISYARLLDQVAPFAVLANGIDVHAYDVYTKKMIPWETVTLEAARARAEAVRDPGALAAEARHEIFKVENVQEYKRILRACHNAIRNNEGFDPTKAFDELSKVMFTKLFEEKHHGDRFTVKKFDEMQRSGVNIIRSIFDQTKVAPEFEGLFDPDSAIELSDRTIRQLVSQFENYDLSLTEFDVKGEAFEHFLGDTFTGGLGQYFTPRNVVNFMIAAADPKIGEKVVDPFCGTGGFLIAWHQHVSNLIASMPVSDDAKEGLRDDLDIDSIFGVDWNERTAQACRMNLSMHGDGDASQNVFRQSGFVDATVIAQRRGRQVVSTRVGESMFDKCLTNPPFGATETDPEILEAHDLGRGRNSIERAALAMERAIRLAKPGGTIAIVIMDGILANPSMKFVRDWVRRHAVVKGMISLNPETFEGYGGRANTSILLLEKRPKALVSPPKNGETVFMAMCLNSGYAPNGREIEGNDLVEILDAYLAWRDGRETSSELVWVGELRERLDPRHYWRPVVASVSAESVKDEFRGVSGELMGLANDASRITADIEEIAGVPASQFERIALKVLVKEHLWKDQRVALDPGVTYREVGVRWWGGGAFVRDERRGADIKGKHLAPVVGGALVYNRMFAFRGAFAVAGDAVKGGYVSNEFPMFSMREGLPHDSSVLLRYLAHILASPTLRSEIDAESQGSTKTSRNRLSQDTLMGLQVPIPKDAEQMKQIVALLDRADALRDGLRAAGERSQGLRDSVGNLFGASSL